MLRARHLVLNPRANLTLILSILSIHLLFQAAFWFSALPALAEDAPIPAPSLPFNLSPFEVAIAFAPVAFYAVLTVYRNFVNPKASISDVLFLVAAFLIVGNLISGLVFKVRLF